MNNSSQPDPRSNNAQQPASGSDSQKYQALLQHMQQGFCIIEVLFDAQEQPLDYRFLEVNPIFEAQTGLQDAVGKTMRQLQPAHEQHWFELYGQVAKTGQSMHVEQQAAHLAGGVWYDVFAFPFGEAQHHQVAILFHDITERKRRERQQAFLLAFSDDLRTLGDPKTIEETGLRMLAEFMRLDRAYVFVLYQAQDRAVVRSEQRKGHLPSIGGEVRMSDFPQTVTQIEDQTIVFHDIDSDARLSALNRLSLQAVNLQSFVCASVRKGERNVIWSIAAVSATPRTWTRNEIELIEIVAERLWAAVERAKAEEALRQEDRHKDEFMAMLGHELRNPLAIVSNTLLYLELTQGQDPALSYPKGNQQMSHQVKHLNRMVDDLLDVSRIRQGKIRIQRQPIDLALLVSQTVEAARSLFEDRARSTSLQLPPNSLWIEGDAARLSQTLMNLLTNAAKYTDEGGHVWVSLAEQDQLAVLRVRDNGMGIPAEELTAIFETFVQGDTSLDRPHGGLGLGLAVVKQIVAGHDGRIEARSPGRGQGSEFVIELPLLTAASKEPSAPVEHPQPTTEAERVLLVDDNQELADITAKLLGLLGYQVHTCYSGQAGIEVAEAWRPDVLLLDIGMPYLDGYQVCRRIRQQAWGQSLPIIALTGFGREADKQRSWAAGFDAHLLKPIDYTTLPEILAKTIAAKEGSLK